MIARAQQAGDRMEAVLAPAFDRASAGYVSTLPEALVRQVLSASSSHAALMGVWNGLVQSSSGGDEGTLLIMRNWELKAAAPGIAEMQQSFLSLKILLLGDTAVSWDNCLDVKVHVCL